MEFKLLCTLIADFKSINCTSLSENYTSHFGHPRFMGVVVDGGIFRMVIFSLYPAGKHWSPGHPKNVPSQTFPGRPLKILFVHPGDAPIWRRGVVWKWRPGDDLIWRSRDVPGRLIRDVPRTFSGRPVEDLRSTQTRMSQNLFELFFQNLFDWPNLLKSISTLKMYWDTGQTCKMVYFLRRWSIFCEIS